MQSVAPGPSLEPPEDSDPEHPIAGVAHTSAELSTLLADKPAGWRWAAFASVLVQRRAAVQSRLLDCELGYATPVGPGVNSGIEVASFATACMSELVRLVGQVEAFMLTPAFMGVFGKPGDERTADAEGIVHVANRLMDYHEQFLKLAERCRDFAAPTQYAGLAAGLLAL